MDYENDLEINELALDQEWLSQPQLRYKYSKHLPDAIKTRDLAKETVSFYKDERDLIKAELDSEARDTLEYNGKKPTESQVANWIIQQGRYKEAQAKIRQSSLDLAERNYQINVLTSVLSSIDDRKSALENLVRLWLGEYYSTPIEPKETHGKLGKQIEDNRITKQRKGLKIGGMKDNEK